MRLWNIDLHCCVKLPFSAAEKPTPDESYITLLIINQQKNVTDVPRRFAQLKGPLECNLCNSPPHQCHSKTCPVRTTKTNTLQLFAGSFTKRWTQTTEFTLRLELRWEWKQRQMKTNKHAESQLAYILTGLQGQLRTLNTMPNSRTNK